MTFDSSGADDGLFAYIDSDWWSTDTNLAEFFDGYVDCPACGHSSVMPVPVLRETIGETAAPVYVVAGQAYPVFGFAELADPKIFMPKAGYAVRLSEWALTDKAEFMTVDEWWARKTDEMDKPHGCSVCYRCVEDSEVDVPSLQQLQKGDD